MLQINENTKSIQLKGPLGSTTLNYQKFDVSGSHCITLDSKEVSALNVINISQPIKKKQTNKKTKNQSLKSFLEQTSDDLVPTNHKKKAKNSLIATIAKQKQQGVSRGFFTYLRLVGVGFRVFLVKNQLTFKLGFSHFVKVTIPSSIRVFLPEPTLICFYGLDKNQVTQIAAKIKEIKPPSPYKGKGIRVLDSQVRIKVGKKKS
mgnify:CR=1 FL=1